MITYENITIKEVRTREGEYNAKKKKHVKFPINFPINIRNGKNSQESTIWRWVVIADGIANTSKPVQRIGQSMPVGWLRGWSNYALY